MTFSTFTYNLTRAPFNLKFSPNSWQPSWGENVVMCCRQSSEDAGPLSFDAWREQAGSAGPCALLRFSVMIATVLYLVPVGLRKHIYSWWFLLPLSAPREQTSWGAGWGLQTLSCPFPGHSFLFLGMYACLQMNLYWTGRFLYSRSCTEWTQNHSSVLGYVIPALNLSVRQSWVLGLNMNLIEVWGSIRKNNDRVQQLNIRKILWKNSECGSYIHPY